MGGGEKGHWEVCFLAELVSLSEQKENRDVLDRIRKGENDLPLCG